MAPGCNSRRLHQIKMKKLAIVLFLLLISSIWLSTAQAETVTVLIDGKKHTDNFFIYNLEGKDYVSLADTRDLLNLSVSWNAVAQRVVIESQKGKISFLVNNPRVVVKEKIRYLNYPARLFNGGIIVPMEFLTEIMPEILDCRIDWDLAGRCLQVTSKGKVIIGDKEDNPAVKLSSRDLKKGASDKTGSYLRKKRKSSTSKSYRIDLVVIDPGHGGRDPGAIGRKGLKEKDVVLDIANRLSKKLKQKGIKVILTRSRDEFIPLDERTAIANRNRADLFLSIHANAAFTRRANGFETYYVSEAVDDHARAVAAIENSVLELERKGVRKKMDDTLHAILWDLAYTEFRVESIEWGEIVQQELNRKIRGENRGVKPGPFYVLKGAQMPSLLVEVGFISNVVEENRLRKSSYREKITEALADSILRYKRLYEKKAGFTR